MHDYLSTNEIEDIITRTGIEIIYAKNIYDINSSVIPDHCGVYIITTQSGKKYIGSSTNVSKRISAHKNKSKSKQVGEPIKSVSIYLTENVIDARRLERRFIQELNPEINRKKFNIRKSTKTVTLNNYVHKCIKVAQTVLYGKYNIEIPIPEIIAAVISDPEQVVKTILEKRRISPNTVNTDTVNPNILTEPVRTWALTRSWER